MKDKVLPVQHTTESRSDTKWRWAINFTQRSLNRR